jgi:hypothetical protein
MNLTGQPRRTAALRRQRRNANTRIVNSTLAWMRLFFRTKKPPKRLKTGFAATFSACRYRNSRGRDLAYTFKKRLKTCYNYHYINAFRISSISAVSARAGLTPNQLLSLCIGSAARVFAPM